MRPVAFFLSAVALLGFPSLNLLAGEAVGKPLTIQVLELAKEPVVDGILEDWPAQDHPIWHGLQVQPALVDDLKNLTGKPDVRFAVGLFGEYIYVAAHWPDAMADTDFKPWRWRQDKYEQGTQLDDMFALRFLLDGRYDRCMFPEGSGTYQVDVWQWSAGRSNLAGLAEDMTHTISTQFIEDAAEYPMPDNRTIYIKKRRDDGESFYKVNRPDLKKNQGDRLPGVLLLGAGSGSLVDVKAAGKWQDGYWTLEMARKRVTGHPEDVSFLPGRVIPGGIAVFNKGNAEHKSVEGNLLFDLSGIKK